MASSQSLEADAPRLNQNNACDVPGVAVKADALPVPQGQRPTSTQCSCRTRAAVKGTKVCCYTFFLFLA